MQTSAERSADFNVVHQGMGLWDIALYGDPSLWLFLLGAVGVGLLIVLAINLWRGGE